MEGKIVLTNRPEMASPAFLVFKIFAGGPPYPPSRIKKYVINFSNTSLLLKSEAFNLGVSNKRNFPIDL